MFLSYRTSGAQTDTLSLSGTWPFQPSGSAKTSLAISKFSNVTENLSATSVISQSEKDWLVALANSIMYQQSNAVNFAWDWSEGVMMYGIWRAYEAVGDSRYLQYIKTYVDTYVDVNGNISAHIDRTAYVNRVCPGILLVCLYQETGLVKYSTAARKVADYVRSDVPRVTTGALVHESEDQLWIDTLFMACVFLSKMTQITGDPSFLDDAVQQIKLHIEKLWDDQVHLFYHGWDENGSASWADPSSHRSPCFWARGNGWALTTLVEVLKCCLPTIRNAPIYSTFSENRRPHFLLSKTKRPVSGTPCSIKAIGRIIIWKHRLPPCLHTG